MGFALTNSASMPIALHYIPKEKLGLATGKTMMFRWLGGAIGSASSSVLFTILISSYETGTDKINSSILETYHYGMSTCMLLMAIACAISLLIGIYVASQNTSSIENKCEETGL